MSDWRDFYCEAVLETDDARMPELIDSAHRAIQVRVHELAQDHMGTPEERQAIANALSALDTLRAERLGR